MSRYIKISLISCYFWHFSWLFLYFSFSTKSVTRVATRGPPGYSSRVMSTFAIKSRQYTITLYTPGHLHISWDVFAKKSGDILSFRNSFITISRHTTYCGSDLRCDFFWILSTKHFCPYIFSHNINCSTI